VARKACRPFGWVERDAIDQSRIDLREDLRDSPRDEIVPRSRTHHRRSLPDRAQRAAVEGQEHPKSLRYQIGIIEDMAMTLRLSDEQTDALRRRADREGRSMQQVALSALEEYLLRADDDERTDRLAERGAQRYAELLRRLGE
jgi:predicted transcriptional regulator